MSLDILNILQIAPPFSGVGGGPIVLPPPTYYTLSGPASGYVGVGAGFTVELGPGPLGAPVTIIPFLIAPDGDLDGDFSPATLVLTDAARSGTFIFTPSATGAGAVSMADDGGLDDPPDVSFVVLEGTPPQGGAPIHVLRPAPLWRHGRLADWRRPLGRR